MKKLLNGTWELYCEEAGKTFPARVPGDITMDCFRAGEIADPKYAMNYKKARYVLERDYEYRLAFSADKPKKGERAKLVFKGIDTFAEVILNGVSLGKTENMFLKYEYDVSDLLQGRNTLVVKMFSTLKYMDSIDASSFFGCFNRERIFLRKEQCCFGWDWAPDLPGYGIWDDVSLEYRSEHAISEIKCRADTKGRATLFTTLDYNVRMDEYAEYAKTDTLRYTLETTPGSGFENALVREFPVTGSKNFRTLTVTDPKLWSPVGYGEPNLYAYRVELLRNGEVLDKAEGKLGFRKTELIEEPIGKDRMSFKLRINGTDVFVKGSNWVPCECFTGEVADEKYEKLIDMAVKAGINMLRVWGGGIYEKDIFYKLCDEKGVMVWQDFMFACADIPEMDKDFVDNVQKECVYQVKRLRNHPSIVYWCGGNEKTGSCGLLKQYGDNLVDITLRGIVQHYDGSRPYVRQSPYSMTDIGNDPESGETHGNSFDIIHLEDYNDFLKTSFSREVSFASECAIMGSCVPESYREFVPEDQLWPLGEIYEDRFCDNPYGDLMSFVKRQEKAVALMFGEAHGIDEFAVKSMSAQAEVLKVEIQNLRRKRDICGGMMNWMYSDVWQTGTWSVVDYNCRPKIAYYTLKREFAPFRGVVVPDGQGNYHGYLLNDRPETIETTVTVGGGTLDGVYGRKITLTERVEGCSVKYLGTFQPYGDFLVMTCTSADGEQECVAFTKLFKDLGFTADYKANVGTPVKVGDTYDVQVKIEANKYVRTAHIVLPEGAQAEDDWFDVLPGKIKTVTVHGLKEGDERKIGITDYSAYLQ